MRTSIHKMRAAALMATALLVSSSVHAQLVNFTTGNLCTQGNDWVIDGTNGADNRLGQLQGGTYGDPWSQWANIGLCDVASFPPANCNYYGFTSNWSSDRAFFGLRYDNWNEANAMIAFGDNVDMQPDINRLIFQFDSWIPSQSLEIGTMVATGNFGLHTAAPTATLHVDAAFKPLDPGTFSNVRFENLQNGKGNLLVIDATGYVYDSKIAMGTVAINNCYSTDFVPKYNSGMYVCSQIYDDGNSVGIGTTGAFPFTVTLTNNVQPGPWSSVTSGILKLKVNGITMSDGYLITSDARYKKDVTALEGSLDKLLKMRGVAYNWDKARNPEMGFGDEKQLGFIAQEVEKVLPEMVYTLENGYKAVNYTALIPVVVEAIKEQQTTIASLQDELARIKDIQSGNLDPLSISSTMTIHPNPSNTTVIIGFTGIDPTAQSAIMIFDMNGKLIKTIELTTRELEKLELAKGTLEPGMYLVSLISNNKELHTQRLIIQQ
ncbi:MAG: tail fiber domain-containing protein [Bacteroidota bacterium]